MAFDQVKMLNKLRKAQSDLKKEIIEVEAGDGAVVYKLLVNLKLRKLTSTQPRLTSTTSPSLNTGLKLLSATDLLKPKK